jgi:hypothetical protein
MSFRYDTNLRPPQNFVSIYCESLDNAHFFARLVNELLVGFKAFANHAHYGPQLVVIKENHYNQQLTESDLLHIHNFIQSEEVYSKSEQHSFALS